MSGAQTSSKSAYDATCEGVHSTSSSRHLHGTPIAFVSKVPADGVTQRGCFKNSWLCVSMSMTLD